MICDRCGATFTPVKTYQKHCSAQCRKNTYNANRRAKLRAQRSANPPQPKRPRRKARCKWCRGNHITSDCRNRSGAGMLRQFGTIGPGGEYVPPPGVQVAVWHLPRLANGDTLTAMKEARR